MKHKFLMVVFILMSAIPLFACSSVQQMIQGTPTFTPTNTQMPSPTITMTQEPTSTPTKTPTPTVTPNLTATQQYLDFTALIQNAYDAGQISTTQGTYHQIDDFSDELIMDYGFRWRQTGVIVKNFIVRAQFDWEVANQKNFSGCGFLFRQLSSDAYYLISLDAINGPLLAYPRSGVGLHGVSTWHESVPALKKTKLPDMGPNPYRATFSFIVNDRSVYVYVNDDLNSEYKLKKDVLPNAGDLSPMILTGSETDFGTRCKITNAAVWIISQ